MYPFWIRSPRGTCGDARLPRQDNHFHRLCMFDRKQKPNYQGSFEAYKNRVQLGIVPFKAGGESNLLTYIVKLNLVGALQQVEQVSGFVMIPNHFTCFSNLFLNSWLSWADQVKKWKAWPLQLFCWLAVSVQPLCNPLQNRPRIKCSFD